MSKYSRYIDAEALKHILNASKYYGKKAGRDFADMITECDTADVQEVQHGRWKPFDLAWGRSIYACTACGDALEVPTECGKPMYKFCPYCGARMDLESDIK